MIKIHEEPVSEWQNLNDFNLLKMAYEDPEKYAETFQSYALLTMMKRQLEKVEAHKINVMERSVQSSYHCFMEALAQKELIKQPTVEVFKEWFEFIQRNFQIEPNLIVYLKSSPSNLINRIKQRKREGEQNITLDYLQLLHDLHENWIKRMRDKYEIVTVDADSSMNTEVLKHILDYIQTKNCM